MPSISFDIPGKPQGKARARTFFNRNMGKMQSVTPLNTVNYENLIKILFLQARPVPFSLISSPVTVQIDAFYRRTKGNKMPAPMLKPDADNICKCVLDSLNGVAYLDDKQVVKVLVSKHWAPSQEEKMTVNINYQ